MSEIRISPDGRDVAIRNRIDKWSPWRVTDGSYRSDTSVADWTPLDPRPLAGLAHRTATHDDEGMGR